LLYPSNLDERWETKGEIIVFKLTRKRVWKSGATIDHLINSNMKETQGINTTTNLVAVQIGKYVQKRKQVF